MPFPSHPSSLGEEYSYVALDYTAFPINVLLPHLNFWYYTEYPVLSCPFSFLPLTLFSRATTKVVFSVTLFDPQSQPSSFSHAPFCVGKCNLLIYRVKMYVTVCFGVERSKNLNHPGTRGYFIKLTTQWQSVEVRDQASHPNKATGKIIMLYIAVLILMFLIWFVFSLLLLFPCGC
jgi:hypothetical protein